MATTSAKRKQAKQAQTISTSWMRWAISVALLLTLVGGSWVTVRYLSQPGKLPLRVVEVNGEFRYLQRGEIQQTVVKAIDGGFFTCDMQKLRRAVLDMPWVEEVSIRRVWPDKLSMNVVEQVPLARWGDDALISVQGRVFAPSSVAAFGELVRLNGPKGNEKRVVSFYRAVASRATKRELRVTEVELDQRRHWWLRFEGGLTVSLGREDVDERLTQFFRVYPSLASQSARQPERVDMRYAHGFAVRWREIADDDEAAKAEKLQEKV